jgi:hypothetical protein
MSLSPSQRRTLETEVQTDPLGRGYSGMTDAQVVTDLNTVYRTRNKSFLSGDEVFAATEPTEFNALDDGSSTLADIKNQWLSFCGRDTIDAFVTANEQFVIDIFGGGSTTVSNLQDLRTEDISRAQELGLHSNITPHQVNQAR